MQELEFRGPSVGKNRCVIEPVLLLHGYDSKPSALGDVADRLGSRAELVAGFEDLPSETFAWWFDELSVEARQDLTEYLDEIALEASRALAPSKVTGLAGMLASKTASASSNANANANSNENENEKENANANQNAEESRGSLVSVVGFSQGAAAAYSWLLDPSRQTSANVIVAVAGFLPELAEHQLRERTVSYTDQNPVHIHAVHLSDDEVVDGMVSERASRQLAKAGFMVTNHHVDGSHAWSPALTELVSQLLLPS
jgi:predicted esterase